MTIESRPVYYGNTTQRNAHDQASDASGDLFWDYDDEALYAWDGGAWVEVGGALPVHDHSTAGDGGQNLRAIDELEFDDAAALTIDGSGAITRTQVYHSVDTNGAAALDNLDTINGGVEGDVLILKATNDARQIVVRHDQDNIWISKEANIILGNSEDHLILIYSEESMWCDIGWTKNDTNRVNRLTSAASPYTVLLVDHVIFCDTDGGAITLNLPAGIKGKTYRIVNCGSSANDVTVDPNGTEQLFGAGAGVAHTLADGESIIIHYHPDEDWW